MIVEARPGKGEGRNPKNVARIKKRTRLILMTFAIFYKRRGESCAVRCGAVRSDLLLSPPSRVSILNKLELRFCVCRLPARSRLVLCLVLVPFAGQVFFCPYIVSFAALLFFGGTYIHMSACCCFYILWCARARDIAVPRGAQSKVL